MEGFEAVAHFEALELKYARYAQENPKYRTLFDFYTALAHTLALKCCWHDEAAAAVRSGNREKAADLAADLPATIDAVQALRSVWRKLWESTNKPFGFEVIDFRMGGICARLSTAAERMAEFARGEVDDIPELSSETLIFKRGEKGFVECTNVMRELLTCARLDH